jgi:predicted MFS family arabinose efflux permease
VTSFLCWALIPKYACKVETACSAVAAGEPCCTKAENFGWRYTMFFVGGISVLAFLARYAPRAPPRARAR